MAISPTVAAIMAGIAAVTSVGGTIMSTQAAGRAADATAAQNAATFRAQNEAFNQRITAGLAQTAAQRQASEQTLAERSQAATQMRQSQIAAQQRQTDILNAENQQEDLLRQAGDTQAQQLLDATSQQKLQQGQAQAANAQNLLLDQNAPSGPAPTDPQGTGDDTTKQAIATRMAQAASNVRTYGSKAATLAAYDQPTRDISLAILANKYGIMPAQAAETLLKSGSSTRLLPAQVAFRNAGDLGGTLDALLASKGQNNLDTASLAYNNAVAQANLGQSDSTTIAKNIGDQQRADAAFQQGVGGIISGVGNLGLYGAGFLGGGGTLFGKGVADAGLPTVRGGGGGP